MPKRIDDDCPKLSAKRARQASTVEVSGHPVWQTAADLLGSAHAPHTPRPPPICFRMVATPFHEDRAEFVRRDVTLTTHWRCSSQPKTMPVGL